MFWKSILLILLIAVCLVVPAGIKRLTRGFKISKMRLELACYFDKGPNWEISPEVKKILTQPFRYLDKGAQCYAFLSEDGNYVLKMFRFDQRHLFRKKEGKRPLAEKVSQFFEGCRLAFIEASKETGLLYLHLNPTQKQLPVLHARGPLNRFFQLPLDEYRFALQKKALPLMEVLSQAKKEGQLEERIEEIISLLERRIGKRIGNTDPNLWRNFGFLDQVAIEIDFGNYLSRPDFANQTIARAELERYMRPLRSWLEVNAPESLPDFNARLERAHL